MKDFDGTALGVQHTPNRVPINAGGGTVPVDIVSMDYAISWLTASERDRWEVVVTPNLHHLRVVRSSPHFTQRYTSAALSLSDGWPVAWLASRIAGRPVERVVGADLFEALVGQPGQGKPLLLIGGTSGPELEALVARCQRHGWRVSHEAAPRAELMDPALRAGLASRSARAGTGGMIIIGVGAPRQEELAAEIAALGGNGAILCLGMSINFSSGVARRAPQVLRAMRLEWAYRALGDPRRLLARYSKDLLILPLLIRDNFGNRQ